MSEPKNQWASVLPADDPPQVQQLRIDQAYRAVEQEYGVVPTGHKLFPHQTEEGKDYVMLVMWKEGDD